MCVIFYCLTVTKPVCGGFFRARSLFEIPKQERVISTRRGQYFQGESKVETRPSLAVWMHEWVVTVSCRPPTDFHGSQGKRRHCIQRQSSILWKNAEAKVHRVYSSRKWAFLANWFFCNVMDCFVACPSSRPSLFVPRCQTIFVIMQAGANE